MYFLHVICSNYRRESVCLLKMTMTGSKDVCLYVSIIMGTWGYEQIYSTNRWLSLFSSCDKTELFLLQPRGPSHVYNQPRVNIDQTDDTQSNEIPLYFIAQSKAQLSDWHVWQWVNVSGRQTSFQAKKNNEWTNTLTVWQSGRYHMEFLLPLHFSWVHITRALVPIIYHRYNKGTEFSEWGHLICYHFLIRQIYLILITCTLQNLHEISWADRLHEF